MMPGTILVVDDDESLRRVTQVQLQQAGYRAEASSSGRQALEVLQSRTVDLVLTDLKMPGMSGLELLRAVQAQQPDIHEGHVPIEEEDVLQVPVVGWLYDKIFGPNTYYALDTAMMFQESVSRAVNEVLEGLMTGQGLRALSQDQLKPTIRDLAG